MLCLYTKNAEAVAARKVGVHRQNDSYRPTPVLVVFAKELREPLHSLSNLITAMNAGCIYIYFGQVIHTEGIQNIEVVQATIMAATIIIGCFIGLR